MQNIKPKLLTGSLIFVLIGVVLGSIFFISSLIPDSPKTEISISPTPDPDQLSSPEENDSSFDKDVAGIKTSASPTKKPIPTEAKAKPTSTPAPTAEPTSAPTSTPAPTSEPTQVPTATPTLTPSPTETPTPTLIPSPTP